VCGNFFWLGRGGGLFVFWVVILFGFVFWVGFGFGLAHFLCCLAWSCNMVSVEL